MRCFYGGMFQGGDIRTSSDLCVVVFACGCCKTCFSAISSSSNRKALNPEFLYSCLSDSGMDKRLLASCLDKGARGYVAKPLRARPSQWWWLVEGLGLLEGSGDTETRL